MLQRFLNLPDNFYKWSVLFKVNRLLVKNIVVFLCPLLVSGCMSTPVKLTDLAKSQMKVVRVVALEAPPLEIVPDLLETRMPIYEFHDNLALPLDTERKVFRYPGGLLIAGNVGDGDSVEIVDLSKSSPADIESRDWLPTKMVTQELIDQLKEVGIQSRMENSLHRLPMTAVERDANLTRWRRSVEHWFESRKNRQAMKCQLNDYCNVAALNLSYCCGNAPIALLHMDYRLSAWRQTKAMMLTIR